MTDTKALIEQFLNKGNKINKVDPVYEFPKKTPAKYAGFATEYKSR